MAENKLYLCTVKKQKKNTHIYLKTSLLTQYVSKIKINKKKKNTPVFMPTFTMVSQLVLFVIMH